MLTSELKGRIEFPEYYFENNDKESSVAIDNLILTQGWRRFNWQDVLQNKKPYFQFVPENEGLVISGKLTLKSATQQMLHGFYKAGLKIIFCYHLTILL